ncbi:MAG TPA: GTP pyrophosphokinase [Ignavibacteria bacterium]|nr:GTP pyrophosphokinase [Ignavibacteria bacterium]
MNKLESAVLIAIKAHQNQIDKGGLPYILHPLRIMIKMQTDEEMIVAMLHDVVEDSKISLKDISKYEFDKKIMSALKVLTYSTDQNYEDYIKKISKNKLASKIKIADLKDNLNLNRLPYLNKKDLERINKYHKALKYLLEND